MTLCRARSALIAYQNVGGETLEKSHEHTRANPHVSAALKIASRNFLASRSCLATASPSSHADDCNSFKACRKTSATASGLLLAQNPTAAIMYQGLADASGMLVNCDLLNEGFKLTTTGILGINGLYMIEKRGICHVRLTLRGCL